MIKRIVSIILCLSVICCLCACGDDTPKKELNQQDSVILWDPDADDKQHANVQPETNDKENKEDNKNDEYDENEQINVEPQIIDGHQAMWEDVFNKKKQKFTHRSLVMKSAGVMETKVLNDGKVAYVSISGEIEGEQGSFGLLIFDEDTIYYNRKSGDKNEWLTCTNVSSENITINTDDYSDIETFTEKFDQMEKIEYVHSLGDVVKIYYPYKSLSGVQMGDDYETTFDATIKFEYNGQDGEYRLTQWKDKESGAISLSSSSIKKIDGLTLSANWELDIENKTFTKKDEVIYFEIAADHLKEAESNTRYSIMEIKINSKTYEIDEMIMDESGATISVKGIKCNDVLKELNNPKTTGTIDMEEAAMSLVSVIFVLSMSAAGAGSVG